MPRFWPPGQWFESVNPRTLLQPVPPQSRLPVAHANAPAGCICARVRGDRERENRREAFRVASAVRPWSSSWADAPKRFSRQRWRGLFCQRHARERHASRTHHPAIRGNGERWLKTHLELDRSMASPAAMPPSAPSPPPDSIPLPNFLPLPTPLPSAPPIP